MPNVIDNQPGNVSGSSQGNSSGGIIYINSCSLQGSYASLADIKQISLPSNASSDFETSTLERHLKIASRLGDSIVGQRWSVPLKNWSDAWVWAICEIAFTGAMMKRGFNPNGVAEATNTARRKEALEWIKSARDYEVTPDPLLVLAEPAHVAQVVSNQPRGWSGFSRNRRYDGL